MARWSKVLGAVVAVAAAILAVLPAPGARGACTGTEARERLAASTAAAFVGVLESERREGEGEWTYTFRVEQVVKGSLGATVELQQGATSISLTGLAIGERVGLVLQPGEEGWTATECDRYDPDELVEAGKPIPRPPGQGRAAFLVAGTFGDARVVALDRAGRALAYGFGSFPTAISVCPGGRYVVELGNALLTVRRLRDMREIRTRQVNVATDVVCQDPRARDVVLFVERKGQARLIAIRGGRARTLHTTTASAVTFTRRFAYLVRGDRVDAVALGDGTRRRVGKLPIPEGADPPQTFAVHPDGRRVAAVLADYSVEEGQTTTRVVVVGPRRTRWWDLDGQETAGDVVWLGRNRLAFLPATCVLHQCPQTGTARLFDARLHDRGRLEGWGAAFPAVSHGRVFALRAHRLLSAGLPGGPIRLLGGLPSSGASQLVALRRAATIRGASRRIPSYGRSR